MSDPQIFGVNKTDKYNGNPKKTTQSIEIIRNVWYFCKGKEVSVANPFRSFVLLFKVDGEAVGPWLIQLCPSDRVKDGIVFFCFF